MTNSPKVTAAIKQAADELLALPEDEFRARIEATKDSDLCHTLCYACDPNYTPEQPE